MNDNGHIKGMMDRLVEAAGPCGEHRKRAIRHHRGAVRAWSVLTERTIGAVQVWQKNVDRPPKQVVPGAVSRAMAREVLDATLAVTGEKFEPSKLVLCHAAVTARYAQELRTEAEIIPFHLACFLAGCHERSPEEPWAWFTEEVVRDIPQETECASAAARGIVQLTLCDDDDCSAKKFGQTGVTEEGTQAGSLFQLFDPKDAFIAPAAGSLLPSLLPVGVFGIALMGFSVSLFFRLRAPVAAAEGTIGLLPGVPGVHTVIALPSTSNPTGGAGGAQPEPRSPSGSGSGAGGGSAPTPEPTAGVGGDIGPAPRPTSGAGGSPGTGAGGDIGPSRPGPSGSGASGGTGGDPGPTRPSALKVDTVVVRDSLMTTVIANLGNKASCSVSVGGNGYFISASQTITGPFESEPSARAARVNAVLSVAVNAPQCKG